MFRRDQSKPDRGKMLNLEVSAYVSRQTRKWHSGGRRFDPVRLHQVSQIVCEKSEYLIFRSCRTTPSALESRGEVSNGGERIGRLYDGPYRGDGVHTRCGDVADVRSVDS